MTMQTPDPSWEQAIEELLASTRSVALTLRDGLAARDREALVRSLGTALLSKSMDPEKRVLASWLLKDLASPQAVPFLVQAFCAPSTTAELQGEILEALERTAFGEDFPEIDLATLRDSLRDHKHLRRFMDLLASVGTQQAKEILAAFALDPSARATLMADLAIRPEPWIDGFLQQLLSKLGDAPAVRRAVEERKRRETGLKARAFSAEAPANLANVRPLWESGQFAILLRLAEENALAADARSFLSSIPILESLSKGQRKLLAKLKGVLAPKD